MWTLGISSLKKLLNKQSIGRWIEMHWPNLTSMKLTKCEPFLWSLMCCQTPISQCGRIFHIWSRLCSECMSDICNWHSNIEGILPKGPYLPCVSMAGRALSAGYPRYDVYHDAIMKTFSHYWHFVASQKTGYVELQCFQCCQVSKLLQKLRSCRWFWAYWRKYRWLCARLQYLNHRYDVIMIWVACS